MDDNIYVRLLTAARVRIAGGSEFVCHAILDAARFAYHKEASQLCEYITLAIDGKGTVNAWLKHQGVELAEYGTVKSIKEMREYRLAWIDRMIKEWS